MGNDAPPLFGGDGDRLAQFRKRLSDNGGCPLERECCHDRGHDHVRPPTFGAQHTYGGKQNGKISEHVIAGAYPCRSHVGVTASIGP